MLRFRPSTEMTAICAALLFGCWLGTYADAARPAPRNETTYSIPIQGARGFCEHAGGLAVFDHPRRTLFVSNREGKMRAVESLDGWAVSDVAIIGQSAVYCSRDRILQYAGNSVKKTLIQGCSNLRSIAVDRTDIYLFDDGPSPSILKVNARTGEVLMRVAYDGIRGADLAVLGGRLFVLDLGDRCVHQFDMRSASTKLKLQVGPGISSGSGGICFVGGQLYVHEADFQRLRPLAWRAEAHLVSSWMQPIRMTFVQESANVSSDKTMLMDFDVSVPMRTPSQVVGELEWSLEPQEIVEDRFGQKIAKFRGLSLEAADRHQLTYQVDVYARAIQYDPPKSPLQSLARIPDEITATYLAAEPIYQMTESEMVQAASEARVGRDGSQPKDVRTMITNIAWYITSRFRYAMDDTWDDAHTSLVRGTGSCSEYSFIFASLCRLNGIPTRLMGGIQFADYAAKHQSPLFHRWNEVYFPSLGWIPVDLTKFDDAEENRRDFEFLFGTPGYIITLSRGGIDPEHLGLTYYIRRQYRGGKRVRNNYVNFEPINAKPERQMLLQFP
ncbi:transglutaminase-like domain-containing protein [Planctomycetes bacterium K23_9]|uniref:Transglutaminase-like superfamily protein n=1 Tax=Stieleria marina TaxID=1930275 RepID=A0A517NZP7_9BACT|nr:Transglutaminase-like superfamily protein [Planctomycetes bacterium K23_9]